MCKMLYKWNRETTNTCSTDYTCSADALRLEVFLMEQLPLQKNESSKNQQCTWTNLKKKNHITGSNIKLTIKNQTVYFSIRNVLTQYEAAITCALEILGLWAYTQSCLYMYLFAYHDQLFLKEMMNVFFYKVKAKQRVISICALGGDSTTTVIAHHRMFLSDEEIHLASR